MCRRHRRSAVHRATAWPKSGFPHPPAPVSIPRALLCRYRAVRWGAWAADARVDGPRWRMAGGTSQSGAARRAGDGENQSRSAVTPSQPAVSGDDLRSSASLPTENSDVAAPFLYRQGRSWALHRQGKPVATPGIEDGEAGIRSDQPRRKSRWSGIREMPTRASTARSRALQSPSSSEVTANPSALPRDAGCQRPLRPTPGCSSSLRS